MSPSRSGPTPRFRVAPRGPNDFVLREEGEVLTRLSRVDAEALGAEILAQLGWQATSETGIRIEDREPKPVPREALEDTLRRLRASGVPVEVTTVLRTALRGPWRNGALKQEAGGVPIRRHVKERAAAPAQTPAAKVNKADERRVRAAEREALAAMQERGLVTVRLFEDPAEQLAYEVRHFYLHSVPSAQRGQWPLQDYVVMECFADDLELQAEAVSRQQMLAAIVDVVCNRVWEVQSRQARAKREGGGEEGRPQMVRSSDGALAWRANVSSNTPAARRIMWWQRPDGTIELCRLTVHDDFEMPER